MRYENWDVLLFPGNSPVPVKEFRVGCHGVPDSEFSTGGPAVLPTLTCFVPSLEAGSPFQVSVHSWVNHPEISALAKSISGQPGLVKFEARVFIDGHLVASATLNDNGTWPCIINNTFGFSKNGELETLKFPLFLQEVLQQPWWDAADELGRIKVVIGEGLPRGQTTIPIDRVQNIVAFSFQHAPLSVLEKSRIPWPNPHMFEIVPRPSKLMSVPTFIPPGDAGSHSHSPRTVRGSRYNSVKDIMGFPPPPFSLGDHNQGQQENGPAPFPQMPRQESTSGVPMPALQSDFPTYPIDWTGLINACSNSDGANFAPARTLQGVLKRYSDNSDTSMPDYASSCSGPGLHFATYSDGSYLSGIVGNAEDDVPDMLASSKAPNNTPTSGSSASSSSPELPTGEPQQSSAWGRQLRGLQPPVVFPPFQPQTTQRPQVEEKAKPQDQLSPQTPTAPSAFPEPAGQSSAGRNDPVSTPVLAQIVPLPRSGEVKSRKEGQDMPGLRTNRNVRSSIPRTRKASHPVLGLGDVTGSWAKRGPHRVFSQSYVGTQIPPCPLTSFGFNFNNDSGLVATLSGSDCFSQAGTNTSLDPISPMSTFASQGSDPCSQRGSQACGEAQNISDAKPADLLQQQTASEAQL